MFSFFGFPIYGAIIWILMPFSCSPIKNNFLLISRRLQQYLYQNLNLMRNQERQFPWVWRIISRNILSLPCLFVAFLHVAFLVHQIGVSWCTIDKRNTPWTLSRPLHITALNVVKFLHTNQLETDMFETYPGNTNVSDRESLERVGLELICVQKLFHIESSNM